MKLKFKCVLSVLTAVAVSCLSGCSLPWFSSSGSLMHPPNATGDKAEIQKAIETRSGGEYVLKYPQSGENRSSIIMRDLNNDEVEEAVAMLTVNPDTELAETHIYIIEKIDGKWKVQADFKNRNNDIDSVDFGDVNGDGTTDILVGWSTYSVNQNELYCYLFGDEIKEVNTKRTYTNMSVGDFTNEGKSTVMTVSLASADTSSVARLLTFNDNGSVVDYETAMDSDITKFVSVKIGQVDNEVQGAFVDGLNSENRYNTQLLFFDKKSKSLQNPIYKRSDNGVLATARDVSTVCRDMDNDGVIEIPITAKLPYPRTENAKNYAYQTSWSSFDIAKNRFAVKSNVIINGNYGYSITIPDNWLNKYTASYNGDSSVLTISTAEKVNNTNYCNIGDTVVTYIATAKESWTGLGTKKGFTKMMDFGAYSYGYRMGEKPPKEFTEKEAEEYFVPREEDSKVAVAPTEVS
ncbi:MAG: VCBS repeat-containing protein [Ruminococcus sp.]|nr:VCBS repeat-containing protein [Ruminococcus sp.]